MTRPRDIPEDIWNILNDDIKETFALNANRSFTDPVLKEINDKLKNCIVLNHKINTYASKLRSLTIRYIVEIDQTAHTTMSAVQNTLVNTAQSSMVNVDDFSQELSDILDLVKSRISFYEGALNGG